jgi:hypothetical protein
VDVAQQERADLAEALRLLQNLQRTPTFKRVMATLIERRDQAELELATLGLSDTDRAMLHGRLSLLVELVLHLPRLLVDKELADRSPSLEPDDPPGSLLDPVRRPDWF